MANDDSIFKKLVVACLTVAVVTITKRGVDNVLDRYSIGKKKKPKRKKVKRKTI